MEEGAITRSWIRKKSSHGAGALEGRFFNTVRKVCSECPQCSLLTLSTSVVIFAFITGEVTEDKFCLIPFYDCRATAMKFLGKPSASTQYQVCDIHVVILTCIFLWVLCTSLYQEIRLTYLQVIRIYLYMREIISAEGQIHLWIIIFLVFERCCPEATERAL